MFPVTTVDAKKDLSLAGESVHTATSRARLGRVMGWDLSQHPSLPGELVLEKLGQKPPALVEDASGKSSVGLHHVADLQVLNHDRAVALGVVVAELVAEVLSLPSDLAVQIGNTRLRFLPVLRSFLSSRNCLLSASKTLESLAVEAGALKEQAVRVCDHVGDTTVDGHDRFSLRLRGFDFNQADNRDEPLIPVPFERAGLGRAFDGAMDHGSKVSQLGKADNAPIEFPSLWVWFAQAKGVQSLSLPARALTELLEAALPSLVQLNEKLRADVARNVCKPGEIPTKLSQFVDLIECRREDPFVARTSQPHQPLFVCEVPQEPQGGFPLTEPRDLRGRRVDAIAERLACDHERHYAVGLSCRQGTFARGTQNSCGIPAEELVALLESANTEGSGSSPP